VGTPGDTEGSLSGVARAIGLKVFLVELVSSLACLDFVVSLELRTEAFTVKGRVHLRQRGFLEVYFNESIRHASNSPMAYVVQDQGY